MEEVLLGQSLRRIAFDRVSNRIAIEYGSSEEEGDFLTRFSIPRPEEIQAGMVPSFSEGLALDQDPPPMTEITWAQLPAKVVPDLLDWLDSNVESARARGYEPLVQLVLEYRRTLEALGRRAAT